MKKKLRTLTDGLRWSSFALLLAAGIINAIGVTMFLAPVHLYDSGISGTSMLLWQITPERYTLSLFLLLLNTPLFLFGWRKQGTVFTVYSLWAVLVYSGASYLITNVLPIDVSTASPFAGKDLLLCALFGGLISIFAKGLGLTVGTFVMIYNVLLYIAIGCIFKSWVLPLYSIVTYCVAIKAVDFIVEGLDKAKSAMIVTNQETAISAALSEAFGRGITHIDARGFYSGQEQTIIYFVVNRFQIARLKSIVTSIDPNAFITISDVSDVLGKSVHK